MEGSKPASAIRKGKYKLIEFHEDNRLELYNINDDVNEKYNLAQTNHEITEQLHKLLINWRKSVNARMPIPKQN
jgi:arylsulfatase A-like enzyme